MKMSANKNDNNQQTKQHRSKQAEKHKNKHTHTHTHQQQKRQPPTNTTQTTKNHHNQHHQQARHDITNSGSKMQRCPNELLIAVIGFGVEQRSANHLAVVANVTLARASYAETLPLVLKVPGQQSNAALTTTTNKNKPTNTAANNKQKPTNNNHQQTVKEAIALQEPLWDLALTKSWRWRSNGLRGAEP
jgi:hypothetical protein